MMNTFKTESNEAIRHALAWCVQNASERQEQAMYQIAALEAENRMLKASIEAETLIQRDIKSVLESEEIYSVRWRGESRALLAQLVHEQLALPCGHPDLLGWQEGTRIFREDASPEVDAGVDGDEDSEEDTEDGEEDSEEYAEEYAEVAEDGGERSR